jgi:hypothetical protein
VFLSASPLPRVLPTVGVAALGVAACGSSSAAGSPAFNTSSLPATARTVTLVMANPSGGHEAAGMNGTLTVR